MKMISKVALVMVYFYLFMIGFNVSFIISNVQAAENYEYFVAQSPLLNVEKDVSISSPFWASRNIGAASSPHGGLDIVVHGAPGGIYGYPVYAMADGVVVKTYLDCADVGYVDNACGGKHGNHVAIYHGTHKVLNQDGKEVTSDIFTLYAHLKKNSSSHLKVGDTITAGTMLGNVASSGSSTGDHLHVSLYAPGKVGQNGNMYGGDKSSALPYTWPAGGKEDVNIPFKPTNTLYNALGESQGEGAKASGIGSSGGGETPTKGEAIKQAINDEWKTPKVNFQEREYEANPKGLQDGKSEPFGATTVVGFTTASNNIYQYSKILTVTISVAFICYMALATIYYLVLLPRSSSSWKHADLFEKATGIEAVVTKKNTLDIIGRDILSIAFIAFVLSGAYTYIFSAFYSMIAVIF